MDFSDLDEFIKEQNVKIENEKRKARKIKEEEDRKIKEEEVKEEEKFIDEQKTLLMYLEYLLSIEREYINY